MRKILVTILLSIFFLSSCSTSSDEEHVEILLDYTPNTNHTGLYVALNNGYFLDEGLDVEIIQPSQNSTEALVANNQADFGVSYSENVAQYNNTNNDSVTSIYSILKYNTSGFVSLESKSIESISDFEGKTYCGWGSNIETSILNEVLSKEDLTIDDMQIISSGLDFDSLKDQCDLMWIYDGWDKVKLDQEDIKYNYISFQDLGIDWYTPVIISNESVSDEVKQKFINAVTKGYEYSRDNPQEASDIFMSYNTQYDEEFISASQQILSQEYSVDGYQEEQVWDDFINFLIENEIIKSDIDQNKLYSNEYVSNND